MLSHCLKHVDTGKQGAQTRSTQHTPQGSHRTCSVGVMLPVVYGDEDRPSETKDLAAYGSIVLQLASKHPWLAVVR